MRELLMLSESCDILRREAQAVIGDRGWGRGLLLLLLLLLPWLLLVRSLLLLLI